MLVNTWAKYAKDPAIRIQSASANLASILNVLTFALANQTFILFHCFSSLAIRNSFLIYASSTGIASSYTRRFLCWPLIINLITSGTICQPRPTKKTITGVAQIAKIASVIAFAKQTYVHHLSSSLFSDKQSMQRITKPRICASAARLHVRQSEIVDLRIAVKQLSHTLVGASFFAS